MPDTYTHPNGYTVQCNSDGGVSFLRDDWYTHSAPGEVEALRDFLLDELGLWRDKETGALVLTNTWARLATGSAAVIYDGSATRWGYPDKTKPDRYDKAVARWRATLTPPPREPKPGEVWRIDAGNWGERNAIVLQLSGGNVFGWGGPKPLPVADIPSDRRRLLVEADGTVVSDE